MRLDTARAAAHKPPDAARRAAEDLRETNSVNASSRSALPRGVRRFVAAACLAGLCATVLPARPAAQAAAVPGTARPATAPPAPGTLHDETRLALARLVDEHRRAIGAPAISAAVVVDGRIAWADGFGQADLEQEVPAHADTVYRIASISKPVAATAVMQLVERGLVGLDDPIQKYVPDFPRKPEGEIRLRHLLTHTSGIRHYKGDEFNSREYFATTAAAFRIFEDDPLLFAPGSKYQYSTYGYNLLAAVVEKVSGLPYEQYIQAHVFTPAGMTTARLEHPEDLVRHRARQYTKDTRPAPAFPLRNAPYVDLSYKWAGGGIIATALDLARFDIALNDGRLLKPATLQQMYTPARLTSGQETGYGLGWMVATDARGRTLGGPQRRRHRRHHLPAAPPGDAWRGGAAVQRRQRAGSARPGPAHGGRGGRDGRADSLNGRRGAARWRRSRAESSWASAPHSPAWRWPPGRAPTASRRACRHRRRRWPVAPASRPTWSSSTPPSTPSTRRCPAPKRSPSRTGASSPSARPPTSATWRPPARG